MVKAFLKDGRIAAITADRVAISTTVLAVSGNHNQLVALSVSNGETTVGGSNLADVAGWVIE